MSKYQLTCSCINCRKSITVQGLKTHYNKCTTFKHKCLHCGKGTNNLKFCSHSCRASYTNVRRPRKKKQTREEKTLLLFMEGQLTQRPSLRRHLTQTRGYMCAHCGISEWNKNPITLVVDHIDGNAGNNLPNNLRLLCPNCSSQLPTFGGRNKGKGRKSRGLPLY